jgi:RNA polymerase sigma-70 factor (ECF subfamily)
MNATATVSFAEHHPHPAASRADIDRHLGAIDLGLLRRVAVKLATNVVDPDDLVQDTLERACRNFDRFDPDTNLFAWLRTIMQRLVIDKWRRQGRRVEVPFDDMPAPEPDEVQPMSTRYSLDEIRRASLHLREPLRTTFRLRLDGLGYMAIAERLQIPASTVATRLMRSKQQVRDLLEAGKVEPLRLVAKTEGRAEASSDKACDPWLPRRPPSAQRRPQRRPMMEIGSLPTPLPAAIAVRC